MSATFKHEQGGRISSYAGHPARSWYSDTRTVVGLSTVHAQSAFACQQAHNKITMAVQASRSARRQFPRRHREPARAVSMGTGGSSAVEVRPLVATESRPCAELIAVRMGFTSSPPPRSCASWLRRRDKDVT
jgi:hypothetical protein